MCVDRKKMPFNILGQALGLRYEIWESEKRVKRDWGNLRVNIYASPKLQIIISMLNKFSKSSQFRSS